MLSLLSWLRSHDRTFTTRLASRRRFPSRSSRPRCVLPRLEPLEDRLVPDSSAFGYGPPTPTPVPAPTPTPPPAGVVSSFNAGTFAQFNEVFQNASANLGKLAVDVTLYTKGLLDVSAEVTVLAGKYVPNEFTIPPAGVAAAYLTVTKHVSDASGLYSLYDHMHTGQYALAGVDLASLAGSVEASLVADMNGLDDSYANILKDLGISQPPHKSLPAPTPVPAPAPIP